MDIHVATWRLMSLVALFGLLVSLHAESPAEAPGSGAPETKGWRDDVLRLAQSLSTSKADAGFMLPGTAKRLARKRLREGMAEGKAAILAGAGQPMPRPEAPRFSGDLATTGSVARASSILAYNEGGFLVTRPHIGVKYKRKLCMRCRIVFDGSRAGAAAAAMVGQQLDAAKGKGMQLQNANGAAIAGRLAAAAATGDAFYGTNPRDRGRRDKDAQLRKCLTLPEGAGRKACKDRLNGGADAIRDPNAIVNPSLKEAKSVSDASDKRHVKSDPSKSFEPGDGSSAQPLPDTGFPYKSALLQEHSRSRLRRSARDEDEELFREMVMQEPDGEDADEEVAGGKVSPKRLQQAARAGKPAPSKGELEAAASLAGPAVYTKRFVTIGAGSSLAPEDLIDVGPGGASMPIIETELCLNEGSRAFVYSVWRGLFSAKFEGAEVACDDANP
jgi:hypothetical protein